MPGEPMQNPRRPLIRTRIRPLVQLMRRAAARRSRRTGVVRRLLDLSTSHLTENARQALGVIDGVTAYDTGYGWLMYAPEDAAILAAEHQWPAELLPVVQLARSRRCAYILFDRDADCADVLPTFPG